MQKYLFYLRRVKDHRKITSGHKTRLWCCQDSQRQKKRKPKAGPDVKHRDHMGMTRYNCESRLIVSCIPKGAELLRVVTVLLNHHENHLPYYDVSLPDGATQIIHENLEWSTPVSITPKVQASFPNVTSKQVHAAWTEMSEALWKRDPVQLISAEKLLREFREDVDVFELEVAEGVEQLCWGMKKIASKLKGKVVEIGIDATCK